MSKVRLFLFVALLLMIPGVAQAQSCSSISCTADTLKKNPIYVDPKAETKITADQQAQLRTAIGTTPIFFAFLPQAAADNNGGASGLPGKIGAAMKIPAVVGVVAGRQFRATSGGGAPFASATIATEATNAFTAHNPGTLNGDVMPMLLDFVDRVHRAPQQVTQPPGTVTRIAGTPVQKKSNAGKIVLYVMLFIVLAIIATIITLVVLGGRKVKRRKDGLRSKIDALGASLYTTENGGDTFNSLAKANLTKAWSSYRTAEADLDGNDLDGAETHLQEARRNLDAAQSQANEPEPAPEPPLTIPLAEGVRKKKGQPRVESAAVDPEGRITINNNVQVPTQQRSDSNPHYFGGGYYGGRYMAPGYYGMSWWDYVILDRMLDDEPRHHDRADNDSDRGNDTGGGGGDWGGGGGGESVVGGGDWGGDSTPEPVSSGGGWEAPSSPPASSDWGGGGGGGDWGGGGGGGDSGGGGGGGGGDSGGGGW
jgi:uncharacterized membrane protein YgcG